MSEPTNPEVAILNVVLELPADQRVAYLDQACAGDVALRQQVEALIKAHEQAGGFLEAPPQRPRPQENHPGHGPTHRKARRQDWPL